MGTDNQPIPLEEERWRVLQESGRILKEKFGGSFCKCIEHAGQSAQKLLQIIVENFPSFRDEATIEGKRVALYKRAQILVADVWGLFKGEVMSCLIQRRFLVSILILGIRQVPRYR